MKKIAYRMICAFLLAALVFACTSMTGVSASSDDPADSYQKETASNEDTALSMWFDYPTTKIRQCDHTDTGKITFSIYLAKNEIEGTQFILYSDTAKSGLTATLSTFTGYGSNPSTNTLSAQIYKELYTKYTKQTDTVMSTTTNTVYKGDDQMWPDAIPALDAGETFDLSAGISQAFLIDATSTADTVAGWYSAVLQIKDSSGNEIKRATVFAKVWNYTLSESTPVRTSFFLDYNRFSSKYHDGTNGQDATYKIYYDYMLKNRVNAMNLPYSLTFRSAWSNGSIAAYLNNPRVTAFRIGTYDYNGRYNSDITKLAKLNQVYSYLSANESWLDKAYFYDCDEPTSYSSNSAWHNNLSSLLADYTAVTSSNFGTKGNIVVPFCENFWYRLGDGTSAWTVKNSEEVDATEYMLKYANITCGRPDSYITDAQVATAYANGKLWQNNNGLISQDTKSKVAETRNSGVPRFYDWDSKYGSWDARVNAAVKNKVSGLDSSEEWWYVAGDYYDNLKVMPNFLLENTGIQARMVSVMMKKYGVSGLLYFYVNCWNTGEEYSNIEYGGSSRHYGDGILLYPGSVIGKTGVVGSLRFDAIRDGIEDYMQLDMYEDIYGKAKAQQMLSNVATDVTNYTSSDSLYASNRIAIGNAIENAAGVQTYTVTLAGGSGGGKYSAGDTVSITAIPDTGYKFVSWNASEGVTFANTSSATTTFVMPSHDVTLTYTQQKKDYTVTVVNGSGSGTYHVGDTVQITALPASGYALSSWNDAFDVTYADKTSAITTFTMPARDLTLSYTSALKTTYVLTVTNGTGGGSYEAGATVSITATVPDGYDFVNWNAVSGVTYADAASASTTITMPSADTTLSFTTKLKTYTLNVTNGTGGGSYASGTTVPISANVASGRKFYMWDAVNGVTYADATKVSTTITMPSADTSIAFQDYLPGDINDDGKINAKDLLILRRHVAGLTSLSGKAFAAGDLDSSGALDAADILSMRMLLLFP